jgi:hypothetical protein
LISAQATISRFRRDLTIGAFVRTVLVTGAAAGFLIGPLAGTWGNGTMLLMAIVAVWMVLSYRSLKGSRLAADSPFLIATGRFDEAETRINAALRSFSLFRTAKLLSLHQLAVLRHAQRRWEESALLCRALLGQRLGGLSGLSKPSRLLLSDNLLRLNDLSGTHDALARLYRQRLNLSEAISLQQVQLEYLARIGAWDQMLAQVKSRVQLAELMPPSPSARTQAMLALAAKKTGHAELAEWLSRRAGLVGEPRQLVTDQPFLAELWPALAPEAAAPTGR